MGFSISFYFIIHHFLKEIENDENLIKIIGKRRSIWLYGILRYKILAHIYVDVFHIFYK